MPTLDTILPFEEAVQFLQRKKVFPTDMSSARLQELGAEFYRSNVTSARTLLTDLLEQYKEDFLSIVNPTVKQRADRVTPENPEGNVNTGMDQATARLRAKELLKQLGYSPSPDEAGTIKDLSSDRRIDLVIDTNKGIARGFGWFLQGQRQGALDAYPAQELVRIEPRQKIRIWQTRFLAAARAVGDADAIRVYGETGRMIARKDSPIWQALGDGAGGFERDALGNPFPPFAFNSGMGVRDIAYTLAVQLGVIKAGQKILPQSLDYPSLQKN